jgi:hypothetical protein
MSRRVEHPTPPQLHCLFLQGTVIFPALQITLPISDELARPIVKLVQTLDFPIIGVFPLSTSGPPYSRCGCGMRLLSTVVLDGAVDSFPTSCPGHPYLSPSDSSHFS